MTAPNFTMSNQSRSAVLHADIYGFSRLMDSDEAGTIVRVTQSLAMIRNLVADYGGEVQNAVGDSILALFPSAQQALYFAVEMQRELANQAAWTEELDPIVFRVGINLGHTISSACLLYTSPSPRDA